MTAGMNTRNLDAGRISLPRAGFGALIAGTLLAGSLVGAATYAAVNTASANAAGHAAAISIALPNESTAVRNERIATGNGQLVGDTRATSASAAVVSTAAAKEIRRGQLATGNGPLAGDVRLVVNTPTPRSGAVRDAAEIRHAATAEGILCLTAIETAVAAAEALDPAIADRLSQVRSLADWVPDEVRQRHRNPVTVRA